MRRNYLYNPKLKKLARNMRKEMTISEKILWYQYLSLHEKYKFLRQKPIGNYVVDFYCPKLKLVIEVDGETHLDKNENFTAYDNKRTKELEKLGIKVIRFWNYDFSEGLGAVVEKIERYIKLIEKGLNPPNPLC